MQALLESLKTAPPEILSEQLPQQDIERTLEICSEARLVLAQEATSRVLLAIPGLDAELPSALFRLSTGEAVCLDGLRDRNVREGFESILLGLGLVISSHVCGDGYCARTKGDRAAIAALARSLATLPNTARRPPMTALREEEEEEEEQGPLPAGKEVERAPKSTINKKRKSSSSWTTMADGSSGTGLQEEWMLAPPNSSELKALAFGVTKSTFNSSRRRRDDEDRERKHSAAQIEATRRALQSSGPDRGPALVDLHRTAQKMSEGSSTDRMKTEKRKFSWSREEMSKTPRNSLESAAATDAAQNARKLDSRFSSSFESSFL